MHHMPVSLPKPWFHENPNYTSINVEDEQNNPDSLLNYYKKVLKLRKDPTYIDTFIFGDYEQVLREHPSVYAYLRSYEDDILVVTNFFDDVQTVTIEGLEVEALLLSNYKKHRTNFKSLSIKTL